MKQYNIKNQILFFFFFNTILFSCKSIGDINTLPTNISIKKLLLIALERHNIQPKESNYVLELASAIDSLHEKLSIADTNSIAWLIKSIESNPFNNKYHNPSKILPPAFFSYNTNVFQLNEAEFLLKKVVELSSNGEQFLDYYLRHVMILNDIVEGSQKLSNSNFKELLSFHNPDFFIDKPKSKGDFYRSPNLKELDIWKIYCNIVESIEKPIRPILGSSYPEDVCLGNNKTIKIIPEPGSLFPDKIPDNYSIYFSHYPEINFLEADIVNWNPNFIELSIENLSVGGCYQIDGAFDYGLGLDTRCNPVTLFPDGIARRIYFISYLNIIPQPILNIWVDNQEYSQPVNAPTCRGVKLSWRVEFPFCLNLSIRIKSDGKDIYSCGEFPGIGHIDLYDEDNKKIEVIVSARKNDGRLCWTIEKELLINRTPFTLNEAEDSYEFYINLSYKIILDPETGKRPYGLTDKSISCAISHMNQIAKELNTNFRFRLFEPPVEIGGINQYLNGPGEWYTPHSSTRKLVLPKDIRLFEKEAKQNATLYAWRDSAINIYFAGGSCWGGYSSFPWEGEVITVANDWGFLGGHQLHEIGHYFSLPHPHDSKPDCSLKIYSDILCDNPNWSIDDISHHTYLKNYSQLSDSEKTLVNNTWFNIMSYHNPGFIKKLLTLEQITRWNDAMKNERKKVVVRK